uniref:Uncharacterized protein n=1 Tax=Panagrolaimus sp. ES5 TaxID=591445 RepID=A0AC34G1A4_9BILA
MVDAEISTTTAVETSSIPFSTVETEATSPFPYSTESQSSTNTATTSDAPFSTPEYSTQSPDFSTNPSSFPSTLPPSTPQQTSGPTSCYGLIFAGEMSQSISLQEKTDFLNIVLKVVANFQNTNLKFAITTFGSTIYKYLGDFQNYGEFVSSVNALISDLPNPNGALTYIAPVLDDIYDEITLYNGKGISTLFMGEME